MTKNYDSVEVDQADSENVLVQMYKAGSFNEGGAITLFQSSAFFDGTCRLEHNHAENGGAILSSESKIYLNGDVTIGYSIATRNGGGVYLSSSESDLNCQQMSFKIATLVLFSNIAMHKGGGIHAISSIIKISSKYTYTTGVKVYFTKNIAGKDGGLSLESNAKFYILKFDFVVLQSGWDKTVAVFKANAANYGGAVYVDDDTNSGTCVHFPRTECFFQALAIHSIEIEYLNTRSLYFSQNHVTISGSTLYGGLLDRCAVSQFAEVRNKLSYIYIEAMELPILMTFQ